MHAGRQRVWLRPGARGPTSRRERPATPSNRAPDAYLSEVRGSYHTARPLRFPLFDGWPDASCGYLQFSAAYDAPARHARQAGWSYRAVAGGHFQMLAAGMIAGSILTTPEVITGTIRAYGDVGVDEVALWPTIADPDQVDRLAQVVG